MKADGSNRRYLDANGWGSQWSPTRNEIAYTVSDGGRANLCVYDLDKEERRMLLETPYRKIFWVRTWSPDGMWICFKGVLPDGSAEIVAVHVDGQKKGFKVVAPSSALPSAENINSTIAWGDTDNEIVVAMKAKEEEGTQLHVFDSSGGKPPRLFPGIPADWTCSGGAWSRDGKRLVFSACLPADASHPE